MRRVQEGGWDTVKVGRGSEGCGMAAWPEGLREHFWESITGDEHIFATPDALIDLSTTPLLSPQNHVRDLHIQKSWTSIMAGAEKNCLPTECP